METKIYKEKIHEKKYLNNTKNVLKIYKNAIGSILCWLSIPEHGVYGSMFLINDRDKRAKATVDDVKARLVVMSCIRKQAEHHGE